MSSSPENPRKLKIVIVGAGPSGLLLAWNLLQHDSNDTHKTCYEIMIVEKRGDPRDTQKLKLSDNRTFPIALQSRGWDALPTSVQTSLSEQGTWIVGLALHSAKGGKPRIITRDRPNLSVDRNRLAQTLLEAVAKEAGNDTGSNATVKFYFDTTMQALDDANKTITIQTTTEAATKTLAFDYLVAADGGRSQVRQQLVEKQQLTCQIKDIPDDYRTIHLLRQPDQQQHQPEKLKAPLPPMDSDKIHGWMFPDIKIISCPIHPHVVSGAIVFDKGQDPFSKMTSPQQVQQYFCDKSPNELGYLISEAEATALLARPTSTLLSVRCSQLHTSHCLLLGDAAHAVSASVGQGANSALQDVQVFTKLLQQYDHDWDKALPAYTETRLADAHAVSELSDYSSPRSGWMKVEFILRTILRKLLPKWLGNWILKPMPMEVLSDTSLDYTDVLAQTQWWIDRVKKTQDV